MMLTVGESRSRNHPPSHPSILMSFEMPKGPRMRKCAEMRSALWRGPHEGNGVAIPKHLATRLAVLNTLEAFILGLLVATAVKGLTPRDFVLPSTPY